MSFWAGRKVFVTGATGLLGSWMTEELLSRGAQVTLLMRDWVPDSRAVTAGLLASWKTWPWCCGLSMSTK
jgi:CDP-glucose 4,6-dehydratase